MSKGGRRKGAGRKKLPPGQKKLPYNTRLNQKIITWLHMQSNASLEIEKALLKHIDASYGS